MCGIFGQLSHTHAEPRTQFELARVAAAMRNRGPDACDFYRDQHIALLHTRLSLVDLQPRGNQPMWDASGRYAIVYNGELYAYDGLRQELQGHGFRFETTTDTEVLLYAIIFWGIDQALQKVDGMFAFAIYDSEEHVLLLARDRVGMKPMLFIDGQDSFTFASDVQALRADCTLTSDLLVAQSFLQGYGGPMSGRSFFQNVEIAEPGCILTVRKGQPVAKRAFATWRQLESKAETEGYAKTKPQQWVDELEQRLLANVQSR